MSVVQARPIVTRIGDELYQRLRKLLAGYSVYAPVYEVIAPRRIGQYTPRHLQIVLTRGAEERMPELDCFGNPPAVAVRQTWNIRCHIAPSEKDPTPVDEYCDSLKSAVQAVVIDSGVRWYTFGELAVDAEWLPIENIDSDGGIDGFNQPIAVTYKTDEGNIYVSRS